MYLYFNDLYQRLMASAFSDSLIGYGGWKYPPKIWGLQKGMTMKVLPDVNIDKKARNKKK